VADALETLCKELCRVFLGWRLGEDRAALSALGEGALRIDLLSGECWYDDEPLPALFIAGELGRELEAARRDGRIEPEGLRSARLDAFFAVRGGAASGDRPLDIVVRVTLASAAAEWSVEARNDPDGLPHNKAGA
jgi:hypothetical protein